MERTIRKRRGRQTQRVGTATKQDILQETAMLIEQIEKDLPVLEVKTSFDQAWLEASENGRKQLTYPDIKEVELDRRFNLVPYTEQVQMLWDSLLGYHPVDPPGVFHLDQLISEEARLLVDLRHNRALDRPAEHQLAALILSSLYLA
jgi:hypothetical protein